jgi:hypothetical protein
VEFRERYNIGLALGCWHGEPAEEIQGDAGEIQDRRNYPTSSKASGISGVISQCVGEMIFCVPQYAARDPSFGYNI